MNETTVQYILYYYVIAWLGNVMAYLAVSVGLYRWKRFLRGTGGVERIVDVSVKVTVGFAAARLVAGSIGVTMYELQHISAIATIFILGVTSLLLNTTFILTEGLFLYREAGRALNMPEDGQLQIKRASAAFDRLNRTANAA